MKKLVLLLCVLSAVGCVKSYEDYYTRSFVLSYGNMRGISVAMTDFGLGYSVDFVGESEWDDAMAKRILEILDQIEGVGNKLYERRVFKSGYDKEYYYYAGVPETWYNQKLVDPKYDGRHYWMGGM